MDNSDVTFQRPYTARLAVFALVCAGMCQAQQYVISTVVGGTPPATPAISVNTSIGAPQSIATDSTGHVYFTSLNCVFKLFPNGALTVVAGNSRPGYSGDGGPAVNAQLSAPAGLAVDTAGDIFIADSGNNRVREVSLNGIITTVAGNGTSGFTGDGGSAVAAELAGVSGVAVDGQGNLFIADAGNNRVRKISASGIISTVAGNGISAFAGDGGQATAAQLSATSVALDALGDIFIADSVNFRVREVSTIGVITTVAGFGTPGFSGNGGFAGNAQFSTIHGIAVDALGNLYIADSGNSSIREVSSGAGIVTMVAGIGQNAFFGDRGPAANAALSFPFGVSLDSSGNLLIADTSNYRIRIVSTNRVIDTVAGNGTFSYSGDTGAAVAAEISRPHGIAVDGFGNLFIADTTNNRVREVLTNGTIATVAGSGIQGFSGDGGNATNAQLTDIAGVAVDGSGNMFISDSGNHRVREVADKTITTVAGNGNTVFTGDGATAASASLSVASVVADGAGNLFIGDPVNYRVREVSATNGNIGTVAGFGTQGFSGDNGLATSAQLSAVAGLAVDSSGDLYIADSGNQRIRKVSPAGTITTVAGDGSAGFSGDGGLATSAQLHNPSGVAVDPAGNIYIADTNNSRVRKVSTNGIITTVAGNGTPGYTGDGNVATNAALSLPDSVAVGKAGVIYVADTGNNAIRLLTPVNQSVVISAVVDAASESAVPLSPGKIVVIYGTGLGPPQIAVNQPVSGVFGQKLAETTVSFRGVSAPIYYTSATQVAAIVPYEIAGSSSVPVVVSYQGQLAAAFNAAFAASSPGLFTSNASGAGQAAAINVVDGTLNSAANPVKTGAYISLYATGEGQTSPGGVDGKLGGLTSALPNLPVTATVGGLPAFVQYKGGVFGVVAGLMQVNVQIPASVTPGGYVPVVLTVGNASTVNGAVWIAVSN